MFRQIFRLALFVCLVTLLPKENLLAQDFKTQHFPDEGYLQAWNFTFRNEKYNLFATFLVSNFGPGSHNNGISLLLKPKDQPVFYSTREFDSDEYEFKKGQFYQRSGENWMEYKNGIYSFYMNYGDWEIKLDYKPRRGSVPISKGRFPLKEEGKFVQADIPFSYSQVTGTIRYKEITEEIKGVGGLEHILSNEPVYQYSKKWELVRSITKDGYRIFTGGFIGTPDFPGGFFRRVAVLDNSGHLVLEGTVEQAEVLDWEKEPTSGYTIPKTEVLYFNEGKCSLLVKRTRSIATMSALENISSFLRFFIQLFFAKPYQIHWYADLKLDCPIWSGEAKGYHSNYLINE